jgi:hypothetical protein
LKCCAKPQKINNNKKREAVLLQLGAKPRETSGGLALDINGADEIETEGCDTPEGNGYFNLGLDYLF